MLKYINAIKASKAYNLLENDIINNTLSHSYMLISEDLDALNTLAKLFAMRLYCNNACMTCRKCNQIIDDSCADLLWINEGNSSVGVNKIEQLKNFSILTPSEDTLKTIVIEKAQNITIQAQNKLLKTLEEPSSEVIIIMLVDNENKLLNTIKSRCKKVKLELFSKETIVSELIGNFSEKQKEEAAESAEGLISQGQKLLESNLADEILDALLQLHSSKNVLSVMSLDVFKDLNSALDMLEMIFCDIMYILSDLKNLIRLKNKMEKLTKLAMRYTVESIVNIDEEINSCREKLYFNCNTLSITEGLLFKILEVNYKCRR